ncbi:hypothetical protein PpBr36_05253 [Pyricularia pennisetigena]|uniref:hypothetical protein n=1 Tax=Pyricularia pennisetigena TaxID=1578925 RepID=UPI00114FD9F8|nr:hypothetical protein PpBr36_05253 [Pyricularia pennisetigena]TLS26167.1 hypothetical protein PpBr36_05253 [Pyricularia pennisetigena]
MAREDHAPDTADSSVAVTTDSPDPATSTPTPPPPPLPPRPRQPTSPRSNTETSKLQSGPTTAISPIDIQTLSFPDGSRGTFSIPGTRAVSTPARTSPSGCSTPATNIGGLDDAVSVMSFAPTLKPPGDLASLIEGEINRKSRAWQLLRSQSASVQPFEARGPNSAHPMDQLTGFEHEFDDVNSASAPAGSATGSEDEERLRLWKAKLKHYMILSSAGKPIWSRHGDLSLINSYMGVVQTIISFYEGAKDPLQGFTAGDARFVICTQGPLYFVAISRLGESDLQLRAQLDALYMQILSTLTLPTLTSIFVNRPSSDLRKPLQGTESLLSALADSFTKGSPSAMLGALECLKLRKSHRRAINNAFLKQRSEKLLYGLIVAGGKLVSVIRPRRHSLHPSDLELIFNMLFESDGIKAGGGENWIPLCLPAFNNRGYLYMYVSFFDDQDLDTTSVPETASPSPSTQDEIAIILISPDKESFFELKDMRDRVAETLAKNGALTLIRAAAAAGRPRVDAVAGPAAGGQIAHFVYKSRANVQLVTSSFDEPKFDMVTRRRLMTLYHGLHAAVHARYAHSKVLHRAATDSVSLAWITPAFEFYCVAGPNASRAVMTQGANKIVQWVKREEERLFIVGGGVF